MTDPDRPPVPIATAARQLGITTDAVRARLRRGSLQGYRDNLGRWLVLMSGTDPTDLTRLDDDRSRPDSDRPDRSERDAVVQAVREHIETVKAELECEREQADRLRVDLAAVSRKRDEAEARAFLRSTVR